MHPWYRVSNVDDVPSPSLLVYPERILDNLRGMIAWAGVDRLRPHVKTHKLPQIIRMKLELGITKFKTSTIAESEMTAEAGGQDILLAYQPAGPNIRRLVRLVQHYPDVRFSTIVDDPQIATSLSNAASDQGLRIDTYVDLNVGMNRTGIRPDAAAGLYQLICRSDGLRPAGLHAYDGHIHDTDEQTVRAQAESAFSPVWDLKRSLEMQGLPVPAVVGCGSVTSMIMAGTHDIEVSAGTSVLWDAGQPTFTPPVDFLNAAVLLARVISRPTPDSVCVDVGHKAVASEMNPPRVHFIGHEDAEPIMHSEEHLVLRTPAAAQLAVGSVLYGLPTHICPTVALHSEVWCVREGRAVETWPVVGRARRITF